MRIVFAVLLAACSSSSPPPPKTEPTPTQPAPAAVMTKEACEAEGGRVNASIGGGSQAHCADDETELAPVRLGIEGGWCCKKK
jgi:hypothetical protein